MCIHRTFGIMSQGPKELVIVLKSSHCARMTHVPAVALARDQRCCYLWQTPPPSSASRYSAEGGASPTGCHLLERKGSQTEGRKLRSHQDQRSQNSIQKTVCLSHILVDGHHCGMHLLVTGHSGKKARSLVYPAELANFVCQRHMPLPSPAHPCQF